MNFFALPRRFWWSHRLAYLLHDHLLDVVVRGDDEELFLLSFTFQDEEETASFQAIGEDGDVIEWLRSHKREAVANGVLERTLVRAILGDMLQFLFEAIESVAKGKVSVGFALLRKPFRDQLFLLEWLLADSDDFLSHFSRGPESIDICELLRTKNQFMKKTIKTAIDRSVFKDFVDYELTWELRFDKAAEWSLERLWNRAIHLVTTQKHYRTEIENLNFVFIQEQERTELLRQFYQRVPMVLIHLCGVVQALVERWNPNFIVSGRMFEMRMIANCDLWLTESDNSRSESFGLTALNELLVELEMSCENCGQPLRVSSQADLENFVTDTSIKCNNCGEFDVRLAMLDSFTRPTNSDEDTEERST